VTRVTKYLRASPTSDLRGRRFRMDVLTDLCLFEGSAGRSRTSPARGYCWGSPPREGGSTRRMSEGSPKVTKHRRARPGPAPGGDVLNLPDASGSPKVPTTARGHALGGYDKNLRARNTAQEWRTMKAAPDEACRRPPPKVPEGQETCDPSRSIQVGLSNLGNYQIPLM